MFALLLSAPLLGASDVLSANAGSVQPIPSVVITVENAQPVHQIALANAMP